MYRTDFTRAARFAAFAADGTIRALVAAGPLDFLQVAEGAAPLTSEQIAEHISGLSADELGALVDAAIAEGQRIAEDDAEITPEVLAYITQLGDAREAAETRQEAIEQEATQAQEQAQAALDRLRPRDAEGDGTEGDAPAADASTDADADTDAEGAELPHAVAASGRRTRRQAVTASGGAAVTPRPGNLPERRPGQPSEPPAYTPGRATHALVAAAGLESVGLAAGQEIADRATLGNAINRKRQALRGTTGGDGERVVVASLRTELPEDRRLGRDMEQNTRLMDATREPEVLRASAAWAAGQDGYGLVAAGGLCAPIEQLYDVPVIGSTARPVRDALTNYAADRGGIRWREHLSFGDFAGATGVWTLANDAAVGTGTPPAPKSCLTVECPEDMEAYVESIYLCLEFSNVSTRFDPESTAANLEAAQIAHARFAENRLLNQLAGLSTTLTAPKVVSAIRDYFTSLDQLIAAYRSFYRIDDAVALRAVAPRWLKDLARVDMARGMASAYDLNALAITDATINGWFQARNVNVTWHLDGRAATVAAAGTEVDMAQQFYNSFANLGAVPGFPGTVETLLWVEGDMYHLDGGTLDLGIVRDSTLNQTNRYRQFSETFEGVAHRGIESFRLVSTLDPTGMVTGTLALS